MGKRYGYSRVSTRGQGRDGNSLEDQIRRLEEAGCDEIIPEVYTGTKMDRPKFSKLLEKLEPGDTLVVTKLDRFARTAADGVKVVEDLLSRGVAVHILNMGLVEDTPMGRLVLTVMLAFAQFERDSIVERTTTGKAVAREKEGYREGRPEKEKPADYEALVAAVAAGERTVSDVCREVGVSRGTWYKWQKSA